MPVVGWILVPRVTQALNIPVILSLYTAMNKKCECYLDAKKLIVSHPLQVLYHSVDRIKIKHSFFFDVLCYNSLALIILPYHNLQILVSSTNLQVKNILSHNLY